MRDWLALVGSCHTFLGIKYATQLSPESSLEPGKTYIAVSTGPIWNRRVPTGAVVVFPQSSRTVALCPSVRMGTGATAQWASGGRWGCWGTGWLCRTVQPSSPHCGDLGTQQNTVCQLSDRQLKMLCYCWNESHLQGSRGWLRVCLSASSILFCLFCCCSSNGKGKCGNWLSCWIVWEQ